MAFAIELLFQFGDHSLQSFDLVIHYGFFVLPLSSHFSSFFLPIAESLFKLISINSGRILPNFELTFQSANSVSTFFDNLAKFLLNNFQLILLDVVFGEQFSVILLQILIILFVGNIGGESFYFA